MTDRSIVWQTDAAPLGRAVVAMGVFDGVHLGHQALIARAISLAHEYAVESCVLTFDRDPDQIVSPSTAAPQLQTLDDKLRCLEALGPDAVLVVRFDAAIAATAPRSFLDDVLMTALEPVAVVVGRDFRFGRAAAGDAAFLAVHGRANGYDVVAHDLVELDGAPVTSTRIRALVSDGDVAEGARLLGRPHTVTGEVVHGRGEGAALGVATVNLAPTPFAALPTPGVYAGRAITAAGTFAAGISVGVPPTFPEATDMLEAHLIGFHGDLYGDTVTLEFVERLRSQRRFDSVAELRRAIQDDLSRVVSLVTT